ncbi:MAG: SDR family NAD(P)-dependent oxidoreductase [Elusimicrobia bacterium]|nr:SDR family NAD(P)-dependent oxidoreductase [Elusimicrobiota bacterium]
MTDTFWKGRRVAVTGAGGFIGSHLAEELARRGARVRALVHYNSASHWGFLEQTAPALARRIEVLSGDLTDPYFVDGFVSGHEIVFHLGALIGIPYSYEAPAQYVETNMKGTLHVLEASLRRKVSKVVHTSTSEVFGTALYVPIDEKHPRQGQSPYSATKIGADALAESFHRSFGLPVAIARPFNTYGPRQSARAVIPTIAAQLLSGAERLRLGSLTPVRDFNFVADTVEGFLAVARSARSAGQDFNLGSGHGVTIGETAELLMRLCGRRAVLETDRARVRPDKSEVLRLLCDRRKAGKVLGWKPRWTLEKGLAETVAYVRAHLSDYKAGRYNV